MKFVLILSIFLSSFMAQSVVNKESLKNFFNKTYTLKSKGITDLVVDVSSSKLTENLNDSKVVGNVDELVFRVVWTLQPERLTIDILGIPEGFSELRENLKSAFLPMLDHLLPLDFEKKFQNYSEKKSTKNDSVLLKDDTNLNSVQGYIFKINNENNLVEISLLKPVGTVNILPTYSKKSFSEGKWVLEQEVTFVSEAGVKSTTTKSFDYSEVNGITVLDDIDVVIKTEDLVNKTSSSVRDTIKFKKYKINQGEALKYFLNEFKSNKPE